MMRTTLLTLLSLALLAGLAGQADAAKSKQRGYYGYKSYPVPKSARPAPLQSPRGYRPAYKDNRGYDFPRFGSERWWQLQEDMD